MPVFKNSDLQKLRAKTAGTYGGFNLTKKQLTYDGTTQESANNAAAAKSSESNVQKIKDVGSSLFHGVADKYNNLSQGVAEALAFGTKDQKDARASRDQLHQANMSSIQTGHAILADPTADENKKERARKLIQSAVDSENQSYKDATARNKQIIQRTDPKKGAADVAGIGLDILTAGKSPIKGGGGLTTGRLGRVAESGTTIGRGLVRGAVEGATSQGLSSVAQQEADTGKVNLKRTATDASLGAVLGSLSEGLHVRGANKREDAKIAATRAKAIEDKKMADSVDAIVNGKPTPKLLGAGTSTIQKRIDEIDSTLDEYRGNTSGSKFTPAEKNMSNLGTDTATTLTGKSPKFQKNLKDGKLVVDKAGKTGALSENPGQITQVKSAKELRGLMNERKQLQGQLDALNNPKPTLQEVAKDKATGAAVDAAGSKVKSELEPGNQTKPASLSAALADVEKPAATAADEISPTAAAAKAPGAFRTTYRSIDTNLRKAGAEGTQIADKLHAAEGRSEVGQADFLSKIPTVTKLNEREFGQFVDHLDAMGKGIESGVENPKVHQAAVEWMDAIPGVRERAKAAGIDVGDLGSTYFPKNYEQKLGTKTGMDKAVKHLVSTGQAKNEADALTKLQQLKASYGSSFGHFDKTRKLDLPDYDKSRNALVHYVQGAYNTIGHAEEFGAKGEKAQELISKIHSSNPTVGARALKDYMIATGNYQFRAADHPGFMKTAGAIKSFNRLRSLGLSAILNVGQSTNTATVSGIFNTLKGATKLLSKGEREYVHRSGVILDSVLSQLREQTGVAGKVTGKLTAPGFNSVERFNRGVAAEAGKSWANSLAKKAAKGDTKAETLLREKLGVEGNITGKLTEEQQIQASRKLVDITQFKTGAKDLPAWMSSPEGKLVSQFRTFSYKQTGFMYKEVLGEAKKGNVKPLLRFLAVGVPIGYAQGKVRDAINNKNGSGIAGVKANDKDESVTSNLMSALGNVGAFGVGGDAMFLAQNSKSSRFPEYVASTLGGPTAGYAAQTVTNVGQATNGSPKPLERQALKTIPALGGRVASSVVPYSTSTSDKQNTIINGATPAQKQSLYDFFTGTQDVSKEKKNVASEVKNAVAAGQYNKAQRLADQHNAEVDKKVNALKHQYGGDLPDEIQKYIDSTYRVNYDYYYNRDK